MWDFGLFSTGSLHGSSFREAAYFKISVGNEAKFVLARVVQWAIKTMADDNPDNSGNSTRLFNAIQSFLKKLSGKLKKVSRGFPVKILFFLIGFYCATAFATVIGQTGDWDILSAGLAVAIVEVIGALMYRASFALLGRMKNMISIFNYWKAGLTLGLFLDSFKYEVDELLESCSPLNFEINIFTGLCGHLLVLLPLGQAPLSPLVLASCHAARQPAHHHLHRNGAEQAASEHKSVEAGKECGLPVIMPGDNILKFFTRLGPHKTR
ncbi:hypothetical protein TRIUR3_07634 [Triticum urartu]|uniref:Ycf20-like protein n=2 Tax=Triticum TaxID=4564 RepID=A0A9R0SJT3_TRITD|nr:hypothetical protein TRIUR3_07634 [Triticum urartu]VAH96619.1 unnamed protein product [Triticum turgidum subsp. durum]